MSRAVSSPLHVSSPPHPRSLHRFLSGLPAISLSLGGVFLVGGGVRDLVLGRPLKDVDLACRNAEAVALELARALGASFVPLGREHDPPSFRVVPLDVNPAEVPADFLAAPFVLDITEIHGRDILEDLARRDFTANAMALPLELLPEALATMEGNASSTATWRGKLLDPHSGLQDALLGLIRRTGPRTLADDPLRILRGFRMRGQLGWTIEPDTLGDMTRHAKALARISGERIRSELRLILECPGGGRLVAEMDRAGILAVLFPEMRDMRGCGQNHFHHLDVFEHSLAAVEHCDILLANIETAFGELREPILDALAGWRLPWLKLAVLLHDIGKPGTRSFPSPKGPGRDAERLPGRITFYGHDALGAAMAEPIAARLRLSAAERKYLTGLIRHHLHVGVLLRPGARQKARLRWMRRLGPDLIPAILLCLADVRATLGPASSPQDHQAQEAEAILLIRDLLERSQTTFTALPLVNGHDLLALGLPPGPNLGRTLARLRESQDAGEITTREEALALANHLVPGRIADT